MACAKGKSQTGLSERTPAPRQTAKLGEALADDFLAILKRQGLEAIISFLPWFFPLQKNQRLITTLPQLVFFLWKRITSLPHQLSTTFLRPLFQNGIEV